MGDWTPIPLKGSRSWQAVLAGWWCVQKDRARVALGALLCMWLVAPTSQA
jgi:hypothetical protein